MNATLRISLALALLTTAAAPLRAAEPSARAALEPITVRDSGRVVIDCRDERLPSLQKVGGVLGTNNGSQIYAERERLVRAAHRECMRGAGSVAFVRDESSAMLALDDAPRQ